MYASKADGYGGDHVAVEGDGGGEDFMRAPDLATAVEASHQHHHAKEGA